MFSILAYWNEPSFETLSEHKCQLWPCIAGSKSGNARRKGKKTDPTGGESPNKMLVYSGLPALGSVFERARVSTDESDKQV